MGLSRTEFLYVESVAAARDTHRFHHAACLATRDFGLPFLSSLAQHCCLTTHAQTARAFGSLSIRASAARCACSTPHSTASRNHVSRSGATREVREAALRGEAHPLVIVM